MAGREGEQGAGKAEEEGRGENGQGSGEAQGEQSEEQKVDTRLPADILPESLRGKSNEEIRQTLNQIPTVINGYKTRLQDMETKLRKYEQGQSGGESGETEEEEEVNDPRPYQERLNEEPEEVISEIINKRYGNTITNFDKRLGEMEFESARREIDDFSDYEEDITQILEASGVPPTRENVMGAYQLAVGRKTIEERQRNARESNNMEQGSEDAPKDEEKIELSPLEEEIRVGMGISPEKYREMRTNDIDIEVPTS